MNTSVISEATPSLLSSFSLLHMPSLVPLSPSLPSDGSIVGHFHRKSPQNRPHFSGRFPYVLTLEDCSMSRQSLNLEQMWWAPSQFQDNSRKWAVLGGIEKHLRKSLTLYAYKKCFAKWARSKGNSSSISRLLRHSLSLSSALPAAEPAETVV